MTLYAFYKNTDAACARRDFCLLFYAKYFIVIFLNIFILKNAMAQKTLPGGVTPTPEVFLEIVTSAADDLPTLLARYDLAEFDCNTTQFFKLNNLKEDYRLAGGRKYKLPVLIRPYNGRSIRSTLDIKDLQQAKRIDAYNKTMQQRGARTDNFIASRQLWVPWHELHCAAARKPPVQTGGEPSRPVGGTAEPEPTAGQGGRVFPIFGPRYAKTPLASRKLVGQVYYIISGHGGPDSGAQGKRSGETLCEDEYAYDVSLRLLRLLVSHGATAYMVVRDLNDGIRDEAYLRCDKDEKVWGDKVIPAPQKSRLAQRTDLVNTLAEKHRKTGAKGQTLLEIHIDSRSHHQKTDVFFYYRPGSEPGKALALRMHRTFQEKYQRVQSQRGYTGTVTPRGLFTLMNADVPRSVYVELANIRNDWDQQRLVIPNNRQALANWLFSALTR